VEWKSAVGTTVATIIGTDPNPGQTAALTYSLATGNGDTDNASFSVLDGNVLKTNASFDTETKSTYFIRLRTTDAESPPLTYEEEFVITINNVNETPTITAIANASGDEDVPLSPYAFTIDDPETADDALSVTALSSDIALVPVSGIAFTGTGASRQVTVTPALNAVGTATITVKVGDGDLEAVETFDVTFAPVNDVPLFTKGANQRIPLTVTALQTVPGWATAIADGDPEVAQGLAFNINVISGVGIFTTPPSIDASGTLTYALTGSAGTAEISVTLTDDATAGGAAQSECGPDLHDCSGGQRKRGSLGSRHQHRQPAPSLYSGHHGL